MKRRLGGALRGTVLGAIALGVAVVAIVWPFGSQSESASQPAGWTTYSDHRHGFTVRFPSTWKRARHKLDNRISIPGEILSLGTGPMKVGGGGNCGAFPAAAMKAMGPNDVLISVQEDRVTVGHAGWRSLPHRPAHFVPRYQPRTTGRFQRPQHYGEMNGPGEIRADNLSTNANWTEFLFRDHRRAFYALIAMGVNASPGRRHAALRTLDSLRFGNRAGS